MAEQGRVAAGGVFAGRLSWGRRAGRARRLPHRGGPPVPLQDRPRTRPLKKIHFLLSAVETNTDFSVTYEYVQMLFKRRIDIFSFPQYYSYIIVYDGWT